ncbi:MAG TPA: hypothetical protein VLC10_04545 [Patescibacteria group bacterium]|nr:hypothetical protein [Patescibacteria group bacterium]
MARGYRVERLADVRPEWGPIRHVMAAPDNTSFALIAEPAEGVHRVVFGGRVLAETGPHEIMPMSLSFDGTKLAVAKRGRGRGERTSEIFVNGEKRFDVPFETVYRFDWLDDERLAWSAWNSDDLRAKDDTIHYFVNGEDVTGRLEFEPVLMDRMRQAIQVKEGRTAYMIYDDGSRSASVTVGPDVDRWHWFDELTPPIDLADRTRPEELWDGARRSVRVRYRGVSGPIFDGIESFGGMRQFALNADGRRAAYVGIRYSGVARAMGRAVGASLSRIEGEPKGLSKLWAWPMALLFNPYMGIGHAYIEGSRRYFPVDHDREWKKGYRFASDHFYTPHDELVVTASGSDGRRVVIDEEEGPLFAAVENVRHLASEDAVCYLAAKDDEILRVVAR